MKGTRLIIFWIGGVFVGFGLRGLLVASPSPCLKGDYQLSLHYDTVWVYDGERLVSKYINTRWDSQLDSIILKDNE